MVLQRRRLNRLTAQRNTVNTVYSLVEINEIFIVEDDFCDGAKKFAFCKVCSGSHKGHNEQGATQCYQAFLVFRTFHAINSGQFSDAGDVFFRFIFMNTWREIDHTQLILTNTFPSFRRFNSVKSGVRFCVS